jgi:hypothetical protein
MSGRKNQRRGRALVVACQASAPRQPADSSLHHPPAGQHLEAFHVRVPRNRHDLQVLPFVGPSDQPGGHRVDVAAVPQFLQHASRPQGSERACVSRVSFRYCGNRDAIIESVVVEPAGARPSLLGLTRLDGAQAPVASWTLARAVDGADRSDALVLRVSPRGSSPGPVFARRTPRPTAGAADRGVVRRSGYRRSYRSRFMTLSQALTKSWTNFSPASSAEYTSTMPRRIEFEPKTRSAAVAVRTTLPWASRAS